MSELNIKAVWPDWELQGELGSGAHGKVYLGKQVAPNGGAVYRAIKTIQVPPQKEAIQSAIDLGISATLLKNYFDVFKDDLNWEMTLYRSADSEHLGKSDEFTFIENELEPGWSCYIREKLYTPLNTYYGTNKTGEKEAVQIGKDICTGLTACEKFNLVHGGITPGNIMVNDAGKFLLVDYGISRCLSKAGAKLFKTDRSYEAPEVVADGKHTRQSDIYSLGMAMAYIANGGALPTDAELKNCSSEFAKVIKKATAHETADRYKNATELLAALERVPVAAIAAKGTSAVSLALAAVGMSPSLGNKEEKAEKGDNTVENAAQKHESSVSNNKSKMSTDDLIAAAIIAGASAAAEKSVDSVRAGKTEKKQSEKPKKKTVRSTVKADKADENTVDISAADTIAIASVPPSVVAKDERAKAKAVAENKKLERKKSASKADDKASRSASKADAAEAKAAERAAIMQNKEAEARSRRAAKESAAAAKAEKKKNRPVKQNKNEIPSVSVREEKKKKTGVWTAVILLIILIVAALLIFQPWKQLAGNNDNSDKPTVEDNDNKLPDTDPDSSDKPNDNTDSDNVDNENGEQNTVDPEPPVDDNTQTAEPENNGSEADEPENSGHSDNSSANNGNSGGNNNNGNSNNGSNGENSNNGNGSTGGSSSFKKDYKWATTLIKSSDLKGMSKSETQDIINEIYARNGLIFGSSSSPNQKYFMSQEWYNGTTRDMSVAYSNMNSAEKKNINTIVVYQVDNGYRGDKSDTAEKPNEPDTPDIPDTPDKYLAESHTKYLTKEELKDLSRSETAMLINEIYARHGKIFKDSSIQSYFEEQSWYTPVTESSDEIIAQFNEYEKANMKLIVQYQKEMGYR